MDLNTKEDFIRVAEELAESYEECRARNNEILTQMNIISDKKRTVLGKYADKYGRLLHNQKVRTENGTIFEVMSRGVTLVGNGDPTISYAMQYDNQRESFTENDLNKKVAKGLWEILEPGSKAKTPKNFTFKQMSHIRDDLFLGVARGNTFVLVDAAGSWSRDKIMKHLSKVNEDTENEWVWKMRKTRSGYYNDEFYLYCLKKGSEDTANYYTKKGTVKILKVSKSKEDLLDHLV